MQRGSAVHCSVAPRWPCRWVLKIQFKVKHLESKILDFLNFKLKTSNSVMVCNTVWLPDGPAGGF